MNKNKGVISLGLVTAIILLVAAVGGGAYYLGKGSSKKEVKVEKNNLPAENNQQVSTPSITVLSPNGGEKFNTSTTIEQIPIKWKSSGIVSKNVAIYVKDISTGNETLSLVSPDYGSTNISGIPVGGYKIRICNTNQKNGNLEVSYEPDCVTASDYSDNSFTINSGTPDFKLLSFKANKGQFLAETGRLINSSNVEIKVYYFPTGTGITEPSLLGSMAPLTGSSGSIQTWSLSAYIQPNTKNQTPLLATSIYATLYVNGKEINTINYPATSASDIYESIYGSL